jgi:hypothetical protein
MGSWKTNEEHHEFIDNLAERKFFGEITLYFQSGNIEGCRVSEHHTKTEMREKIMGAKHRRVVVSRPGRGGLNGG